MVRKWLSFTIHWGRWKCNIKNDLVNYTVTCVKWLGILNRGVVRRQQGVTIYCDRNTLPSACFQMSVHEKKKKKKINVLKEKPSPFKRSRSWKISRRVKPRCEKLKPHGKDLVREAKAQEMYILTINKHEDICIRLDWNDVGVPGWNLSAWSNDVQRVKEGETEDRVKRGDIFIYVLY